MLRAAITFFVMGLITFLLGINGLLGVSFQVGKLFLLSFMVFSLFSLLAAVTLGKSRDKFV